MDRRGILEYRLFWCHRLCRTLMGVGVFMAAFACCIWTFQMHSDPLTVLLVALVAVLPLCLGGLVRRRARGRVAPVAAVAAAMLCGAGLLIRLRYPDIGRMDLLFLVLTISVAEALMQISDERLEQRMMPPRLHDAARRVRSYTVHASGMIAPAVVAALMSAHPYFSVVTVSLSIVLAGALLSLATGLLSLRRSAPEEKVAEPEVHGDLSADVALTFFVLNFCMAMSHGALLVPMLLSRATVEALAGVVAWFFAGLSLGQLFDPLQHFYDNERRGYAWNSALALLCMALLFGMARTGWQWNACAALGGVLLAAGWGNLEQMRVRRHPRLRLLRAFAWATGLLLGVSCGNVLEWVMARFGLFSAICARLTGLGEGSGMAMTFVSSGFLSLAVLYVGNRLLRQRD